MQLTLTDRLILRLQSYIPARALGRFIYRLSRSRITWLKNMLIRGFTWLYCVNTSEAAETCPAGYASFNDFFTRTLKAGVRPIDTRADSVVSPVDGTVAQTGFAKAGQLLQAKNMLFPATDLLGDPELAAELADSAFSTIYLAPYNYHRIHMPIDGILEKTIFIPGLLYSVDARTTATIPPLYARNERLVCQFRCELGRFALVMVGAMNVASMSTAWSGEILPPQNGDILRTDYGAQGSTMLYHRGDYIGHFNMGSTVIFIAPTAQLEWLADSAAGQRVQMGQRIGLLPQQNPL